MKQISIFLLILGASTINAQGLYYPIDDSHSNVKFVGKLGDWMEVEGSFQKIWGYLHFDEKEVSKTSISFFMEPASVNSNNEWRDKHLKGPDFLDVEKYSELKFISHSVKDNDGNLEVTGTLYFKGNEIPFTVPVQLISSPTPDPWGNIRLGFNGVLKLSRKDLDFGPKEGFWKINIDDAFTIKFTISGSRQNIDRMSLFKLPEMNKMWEKALVGEMDTVELALRSLKETDKRFGPRIADLTAQRLHQHGHPKRALQLFKLNAEFYPEESWVISKLALSHRANGDFEKCKTLAKKALEMNHQDALALELLK